VVYNCHVWARAFAVGGLLGCGRIAFDPISVPPADAEPVPFEITCGTFEPMSAAPPPLGFVEATLHPDGLRLVGHDGTNFTLVEAMRPAFGELLGAPGPATAIATDIGDVTFATIDGALFAFGHTRQTVRALVICPDPMSATACEAIQMIDAATSEVIVDDHDGPNIAIRDGKPIMTFSRGDDIYHAKPLTSDLLTWRAEKIPVPFRADDPAVTADGEVLIVGERSAGLHVMHWDVDQATFVDVVPLPTFVGGSPAIGVEQGKTFELIATSDPRGVLEPVVATCTRP
jgi:hypothetical protein